jgi:hypothetical protein
MSCVVPFGKGIVDQRDTLVGFIVERDYHVHHGERMKNGMGLFLKFIPLVIHIL